MSNEIERLRKRVAELEAERPHSFREEFGVQWPDDPEIEPCNSFEHARRVARIAMGDGTPVRREVRVLATPWHAV